MAVVVVSRLSYDFLWLLHYMHIIDEYWFINKNREIDLWSMPIYSLKEW